MTPWRTSPYHRHWLLQQADRLFDTFQYASLNPAGGFFDLYDDGRPFGTVRQLHATTRMVHCFAIAHLLGRPGAAAVVDHGMDYIWRAHRDARHGGYFWSLDDTRVIDDSKQAYGHAFVLLAASSAKCIGHPMADKVIADVTEVLEQRFWEADPGVTSEEYGRDWSKLSDYRGQNSNMHLTEALMAAFEATGERAYLRKAGSIAAFIIGKHAAALDYRVAEHFNVNWALDNDYRGSEIFRPAGSTPGHWLEWARLLLQLWELGGRQEAWLPGAAERLFRNAVTFGWDHEKGGFFYTLEWDNRPRLRQKLWWPAAEGIGAAHWLAVQTGNPYFEDWYRRIWGFSATHFIDHAHGGWFPELGEDLKPKRGFFTGKPDIYHALQACLIPLYPTAGSLTKVIAAERA
ncbi:MAG: AGE family epimerase/isomerase [Rhizobiales bacterium]|nr:AGE family epimerase/isomerase [Hyphomicrobiales bacterium]